MSTAPAPAVPGAAPLVQAVQRAKPLVLGQCFLDIDVLGVVQDHVEGGMAQQQPQRVQVHAVVQAVGGEVVPEAVGAAAAFHPGPPLQAVDHDLYRAAGKRLTVLGLPELIIPRGPGGGKVAFQRLPRLPADGHHPELGPLARDAGLPQLGVEVGKPHPGQLIQPEAGVDKQRDNGLVSDAQVPLVRGMLAGSEHGLHLLVGVRLDLAVVGAGQIQPYRRVLGQVLLVLGPAEEELDHLGVVIDGGRGGPAGGRAPTVAVPAVLLGGDITQKVRDFFPGQALGGRPVPVPGKPLQSHEAALVVFHRALGEVSPRAEETSDEL